MKSTHDPDGLGDRDPYEGRYEGPYEDEHLPSELAEAFRQPVPRMEPRPGTYEKLRQRAAGRRRKRTAAVLTGAGAATALAAAFVVAPGALLPGGAGGGDGERVVSRERTGGGEQSHGRSGGAAGSGQSPSGGARPSKPAAPRSPEHGGAGATGTGQPQGGGSGDSRAGTTCATSDLRISAGRGDAGAGSVSLPLRFTNTSEKTCVMTGFPGVSLVAGGKGKQVGAAASRVVAKDPPVLVLHPGDRVEADLRITRAENYPAGTCHPTATRGLRVYPPNQRDALFLPRDGVRGCAKDKVKLLEIAPVLKTG